MPYFQVFFSILIGMSIGIVAGFVGGATDKLLMFLTNVVLTIPSFPVLMALSLVISAGNVLAFGFLFGDLELGRVSSQRSESGHDIAGK